MTLEERVECIKEYLEDVKQCSSDRLGNMALIGAPRGYQTARYHLSVAILEMFTDDKFVKIIMKAVKERKAKENHERA